MGECDEKVTNYEKKYPVAYKFLKDKKMDDVK